ncbi:uncharacterized protein DSM5745_03523 [Aspergillus mulundensis]|uniref:Transferase family protein n=1 Tax=Aspergillus mulundensis TaxID=1810919 RepID=A0A3D8SL19_9EURO|nr:hypothetical protein DSM5745_03523 [Aspergillus mulundensis]RDW86881.1 hypothetical protein DSM5745_03523 [Aspergillus mulundensis]
MATHPEVNILKTTHIFPSRQSNQITVPLSILDAVVTNYAACAAVWFFDAPTSGNENGNLDWPSSLQQSLAATLSFFPHFAGTLSKITHVSDPNNYGYGDLDHTKRYGRLHVTYGAETDPGVEFGTARSETRLDEIVPDPAKRKSADFRAWDLSCPANVFLPDGNKVPFVGGTSSGSPVLIRITQLGCGGVAIGIRIAHPLADAQALSVFMKRWSFEHSILFGDGPSDSPSTSRPEPPSPMFSTQLLDSRAAGDIDALSPDKTILANSRSLPSARHDWFYPASEGDPDRNLPPGLTRSIIKSPGTPMPKEDWDPTIPVSHTKLHFTAEQTKKIWEAAGGSEVGVSRHDALVAHVWSAINRARGLGSDDRDVSLYYTFGLRKRLGLPSSSMGSPILLTAIRMPGKEASNARSLTPEKQNVATRIRGNIARYTEDALSARLHDLCFEVAPQRLWEAYLGYRHVIFTSWARLGLYEVSFGGLGRPRFVEPYMPLLDGLLCLMEGRPGSKTEYGNAKHWCDDGVDVAVSITTEAMERLKKDPELWV